MSARIMGAFAIIMTVAFAWPGEVRAQAKTAAQAQAEAERLRAGAAQRSCQILANDAQAECYADEAEQHASVAEAAAERAIAFAREGDIEAAKAAWDESTNARNEALYARNSADLSNPHSAAAERAKLEYERAHNAFERAGDAVTEIDTEGAERLALIERVWDAGRAGPFGYKAGDEMPPIDGATNNGFPFARVPTPERFDSLAVFGTKRVGICWIRATKRIENDDPSGTQIKGTVEVLERAIANKYGKPSRRIDRHDGTIWERFMSFWRGSGEFMQELAASKRRYMAIWDRSNRSYIETARWGGVSRIVLFADADDEIASSALREIFGGAIAGTVKVEYTLNNMTECQAEVDSGLDSDL